MQILPLPLSFLKIPEPKFAKWEQEFLPLRSVVSLNEITVNEFALAEFFHYLHLTVPRRISYNILATTVSIL